MNKTLRVLFFLFIPVACFGQKQRYYYSASHKPAREDRAVYYRTYHRNSLGMYAAEERSLIGDTLQFAGTYDAIDDDARNGHFIYYTPHGSKLKEGDYVNNRKEGEWLTYFSDQEVVWYSRQYKDGKLNGPSIKFLRNGIRRMMEMYQDDSKISSTAYNMAGEEVAEYKPIEVVPSPPFDVSAFINKTLRYPEKARRKHITGGVITTFVVQVDGSITDVKTTSHVGGGCEAEAIRVIQAMPHWRPAIVDDVIAQTIYTMTINFRLE